MSSTGDEGSPEAARSRVLVVAGLIERGGRVLLTRRRRDQPMPHKWELPGGKIEPGEHPEDALARELAEELGARARAVRIWDVLYHRYERFDVLLLVYACRLEEGAEPRPVEVAACAWAAPAELDRYDILEADASLVARLQREGAPALTRSPPA